MIYDNSNFRIEKRLDGFGYFLFNGWTVIAHRFTLWGIKRVMKRAIKANNWNKENNDK